MKKLLAVIALLLIWSTTFALEYVRVFDKVVDTSRCQRKRDVHYVEQTQPFMWNAKWSENNKNMFKWMWENRIWVADFHDALYLFEDWVTYWRVFIAVNWVSIWELAYPNKDINVRNVAIYYNWQKNIKYVDLHDYMSNGWVYDVWFVGVEVPVNYVYLVKYR